MSITHLERVLAREELTAVDVCEAAEVGPELLVRWMNQGNVILNEYLLQRVWNWLVRREYIWQNNIGLYEINYGGLFIIPEPGWTLPLEFFPGDAKILGVVIDGIERWRHCPQDWDKETLIAAIRAEARAKVIGGNLFWIGITAEQRLGPTPLAASG